jgi:hypothetical protein
MNVCGPAFPFAFGKNQKLLTAKGAKKIREGRGENQG